MKLLIRSGQLVAVYNDALLPVLDRLGECQIQRASDVEWDQATNEWVARCRRTGKELARAAQRQVAIQREVAAIESHLTDFC